jgi:hypothetical protein
MLSAERARLADAGVVYHGDTLVHHDLPKLVVPVAAGRGKYRRKLDMLLADLPERLRPRVGSMGLSRPST